MASVIRRQYLGGAAAALGGLLAAACGEVEVRYVQGPAGPAGPSGAQGERGATGAAGTKGASGAAGQTQTVVQEKVVTVEKPVVVEKVVTVDRPVVVEKVVEVPAKPKDRVKLLYWNGSSPQHRFALGTAQIIRDFLGKHDGVEIEIGDAGGRHSPTKVKAALAANTPPHAWFNWQVPVSDLTALGATVDLDAALRTNKSWPDIKRAIVPTLLDGVTWKDQLTMMPVIPDPRGMGYNLDILKRNAIEFPQEGHTWSDFEDIGRQVFQPDKLALFLLGYGMHWFLFWALPNGHFPLDESKTKYLFDEPAAIEAFQWMHDHVTRTRYALAHTKGGERNAAFNSGRALCFGINAGTVTPPRFPDVDPGDGSGIRVTHYALGPSNTAKRQVTFGNIFGMPVFKGHPGAEEAAAVELALWSVRPRVQLLVSAASGHGAANQVAAKDPKMAKALRNNPILNQLNELTQYNRPTPNPPSYAKLFGISNKLMGSVHKGELVPKDALVELQKQAQPLLDKDHA